MVILWAPSQSWVDQTTANLGRSFGAHHRRP